MEKDTVILSVEKYDRLKEFQKKVQDNEPQRKTIVIESNMFYTYKAETDDEAVEKLAKDLKEAKAELAEAKEKLKELPKELTIEDIKNMSWWEFRKWKRG